MAIDIEDGIILCGDSSCYNPDDCACRKDSQFADKGRPCRHKYSLREIQRVLEQIQAKEDKAYLSFVRGHAVRCG